MIYSIIGDIHCTHDTLDKTKQIFNDIRRMGNPAILLGDLLDTKEVIRGKCFNTIYEEIKNTNLPFIILVGNHDWFSLECKEHALMALKDLPNVKIVDEVFEMDQMVFIPYIHDVEILKDTLKSIKDPKEKTVFLHNGIIGFDYGNGHIAEDGLDSKSVSKFKRVVAGHFHKYQESKNLMFLGAPFSHSFGESNQRKFYGIFNDETNEVTLEDTLFLKHITHEIDLSEPFHGLPYTPDYYRFVLKGTKEQYQKFDVKALKESFPGCKIKPEIINEVKTFKIDESLSKIALFTKYCTEEKKLDSEITKLGTDILKSVEVKC